MKIFKTAVALAISAMVAAPALAQNVDDFIQRNAREQERIEQGLRSGDLTVREAAALEQRAAGIERYQSRALADGTLSQEEARRIDRTQDRFGREINAQRHDSDTGNPNSRSAQRMADEAARNANQQRRIADGVRSGDLTNREAARLERGQSSVNRGQAQAGADGRIGRNEQYGIRNAQNHQSQNIRRERHDSQNRNQHDSGSRQYDRRDSGWHAPRHAQGQDHPGYNGQHRGWENRGTGGGQGFDQARTERRETSGNRSANEARSETRQADATRSSSQARSETRQAGATRSSSQARSETRQASGARSGNQSTRVADSERRR